MDLLSEKKYPVYQIIRPGYTSLELREALGISQATLRAWRLTRGFPSPMGPNERSIRYKKDLVDQWCWKYLGYCPVSIKDNFCLEIDRPTLDTNEILVIFEICQSTLTLWRQGYGFPKSSGPTERTKFYKIEEVNNWSLQNFGCGIIKEMKEVSNPTVTDVSLSSSSGDSQTLCNNSHSNKKQVAQDSKKTYTPGSRKVYQDKLERTLSRYGLQLPTNETSNIISNLQAKQYSLQDVEQCCQKASSSFIQIENKIATFLSALSDASKLTKSWESDDVELALKEFENVLRE